MNSKIWIHRCRFMVLFTGILLVRHGLYADRAKNQYEVASPDKSIRLTVIAGRDVRYSLRVDGESVITQSGISMTLDNQQIPGENPEVRDVSRKEVREAISPVVPEKSSVIEDHFNEMNLVFKGNYSLIFRVYNHGAAYRFQTRFDREIRVVSEQSVFNFAGNPHVYYPEEDSFFSHNERSYLYMRLDTLAAGRLASLPVLVETGGPKILIAESSLRDYPGMWVKTGGGSTLSAVFPPYALESRLRDNSDRDAPVTLAADYIAVTRGERDFPWRILAVARKDADLLTNQLVYQLAEPLCIKDPSWIKPGKVAWDWWNANNIYGVDFKSGVNTETYKYYIDFASRFGIEYIILDEGWYKLGDLMDVVPEMDIEALTAYGKEKHVGIIFWVVWKTLEDQLEEAMDQFEEWGAAGIKVDFMQRDDQEMVLYYWKIAEEAAKRHLLVDYHGAYKPAGLRRAYPNVITREGVKGMEHNKWSLDITPSHNLTLPFIRMVAGPMDYTPGAMINAQPDNFRVVFTRPMSMTTRAHQIAMYMVYESPLQMMTDTPSNYLKEMECTEFIARIPTVWDETQILKARVGEYVMTARRSGDIWYLGAMTNENPREFTVDLPFLKGLYSAEIIQDGMNADRYASDYRKEIRVLSKNNPVTLRLAPAGGWAAILTPVP